MTTNDAFGSFTVHGTSVSAPRFTILMGVKDGLPFLKESVESILAQDFADWELLIIDDGSASEAAHYLKTLVETNPRVRLIVQPNIGLTQSLIRGVAEARGAYIVRQDADDISVPQRLSILDRTITQTGADVVFSRARAFGANRDKAVPSKLFAANLYPDLLRFGNLFTHGTLCAERSLLTKLNYNSQYRFAQDYDLFIRLLKSPATIVYLSETLYHLRESEMSISRSRFDKQLACARAIAREHFGSDDWLIPAAQGARRRALQILRLSLATIRFPMKKRITSATL